MVYIFKQKSLISSFIFLFVLNSNTYIYCQNFSNNDVYIVGRGTISKKEIIGEKNLKKSSKLTHVGIGIVVENDLKIYHVLRRGDSQSRSSLYVESFTEFCLVNDIFYAGIWKFKSTGDEINLFKKQLKTFQDLNIIFDEKFSLDNGQENLYCSEFVATLLNSTNLFNFEPTEISGISKKNKKHDMRFKYFPADFFLVDDRFTLVYEICY